ncbi:MAG TPA: hypothetical protein VHU85_08400 [Acidimicrobiales bacterium]|jgi:hypothetical protein|nr:hypothetical protein [Acidimicrobiales bacterium]
MSPHDQVNQSLRTFVSPIPWPRRTHPRRRVFIFGGCLTWILLGWVVFFWYLMVGMAIIFYIFVLYTARFYYVLGCLTWWGIDSGVGVVSRAAHRHHLKGLPPPPDSISSVT